MVASIVAGTVRAAVAIRQESVCSIAVIPFRVVDRLRVPRVPAARSVVALI
jgi:hypothetical protein